MRLFLFSLSLIIFSTAFALSYNISFPEEVIVGKWFSINITLISDKELNLTLYSYVYKGFNCVGQGWIANKEEIFLKPNEKTNVELEDLIKYGTDEGIYNLRIKFKFENETIVETYKIKVRSRTEIKEIYLYFILIFISLIGLYLILKKG